MKKIALMNATIIDGISSAPLEGRVILLEGSTIDAVHGVGDLADSNDATAVDLAGKWILPGLINMHEHFTLRGLLGKPLEAALKDPVEQTVIAVQNAEDALSGGWTTVREMGSMHGIALRLRDLIASDVVSGPRVISCGAPIAVTGGHAWIVCTEADGPEECRKAARAQLKAGAQFVKVMASHEPYTMPGFEQTRPEMSVEEIRAVFEEGRRWGKGTACHAMGSTAIANVLDAGVDIIDHGVYLTPELADRMAEEDVYLCPTLSAYDRQTMNPALQRGEDWGRAHSVLVKPHQEGVKAAVRAGVKLLAGTDTCGWYAEEVDLMREAGLPPMESLRACTRTAAEALGLEDQVGSIAPGHAADLVVLDADPLGDPYALDKVSLVLKNGKVVWPPQLEDLRRPFPAQLV